ncbi:hypothetical protein JQU17_16455 [Ponticoccus sp. SC2-23]|nr:hypothetical protein [Ponticoccus sp. SC6-9]MBM1225519.1 hypothetical protein [Ponticoccus sp. SC6-15]MBM1227702.1 hypothetical protein [Ponticoccus sp. SC6-38]MBM1234660.1 hypothetical protein [Ponticoccus sp. SC6-45]MBM1238204.1 hypothetical protein [Ponticoccus sp. SC6-49]MBM1244163.1 hypothetical protein [Ponticoccus sp. SC2-64]MBM1248184.1 hypothetical protein [Ponticoccus sp. SC6-42]MBM1252604.1 hypothetical protein [Ponticoccus sp. SC6-33]MBM1256213.1 hypothetical protein [Pontico
MAGAFSGRAGGHHPNLGLLIGEVLGARPAKVTMDRSDPTMTPEVDGIGLMALGMAPLVRPGVRPEPAPRSARPAGRGAGSVRRRSPRRGRCRGYPNVSDCNASDRSDGSPCP